MRAGRKFSPPTGTPSRVKGAHCSLGESEPCQKVEGKAFDSPERSSVNKKTRVGGKQTWSEWAKCHDTGRAQIPRLGPS